MQTQQNKKIDYRNSAIIGFIIGVFIIPIELNLKGQHLSWFIAGIIAFPLLAVAGMFIAKKLFEKFSAVFEFVKFGLTGTSNTTINLGIINTFVLATGIARGPLVILFSVIAFLCTLTNSYYWNSHWSFKSKHQRSVKEFISFAIIMLVGIALNSGIIYLVTSINPPAGISAKLWINIATLIATFVVLFWNFFGYRKIVFKTSDSSIVK